MRTKRDLVTYLKNGETAYQGLAALAGALGLVLVTKEIYEPVWLEAKAKSNAFDSARGAKTNAFKAVRLKRPAVNEFLGKVRKLLSAFLGETWSPVWLDVGFRDSLALPRTDAGRRQTLEKVKQYFTDHPQHEVAGEGLSALAADALYGPYSAAVSLVLNCKVDTREKLDARTAAFRALDKKLAALRAELETKLDPLDPRWLKFFDRIPGDPRPPEKVEDVTATALPGGRIAADWPDTVRAAQYDVFKQVVGVDPELVRVKTVRDSGVELTDVPSGATVRLQIVASNGVGSGAPSDVIELQAA